jgi:hypothetical protein
VRTRRGPVGAAVGVCVTAAAALFTLGGCSLLDDSSKAAATSSPTVPHLPPASSSTYSPLAGPVEAAAELPTECSQILTAAQLQAVFGAGMPIGDDYGSYAALPSIGRTGRVTCVFGVGLDSFGQQSTGALEVSIATYTSAAEAVGRAADTVQSDSQAGATTAAVSVGGHPATIVVEQTPVGAPTTPPAAATATATATTGTTAATAPVSPAASSSTVALAPGASTPPATAAASPATPTGETELVLADGNRTFVLQVPFTKLSAQQALTALTQLALEAYQNTLPAAPSPAPDATASPSRG